MRVQLQVFQPAEGQPNPIHPALQRCREFMVNDVTGYMRIFGIQTLTVRYRVCGIKPLLDISYEPMSEDPPEALLIARNHIARQLAETMFLFGVLSITMVIAPEEMDVVRRTWATLNAPVQDAGAQHQAAQAVPQSAVAEVPLHIERDPTDASILPQAAEAAEPPEARPADAQQPEQ
jgi:hypothetical protein